LVVDAGLLEGRELGEALLTGFWSVLNARKLAGCGVPVLLEEFIVFFVFEIVQLI
jgi:hypothetical protein